MINQKTATALNKFSLKILSDSTLLINELEPTLTLDQLQSVKLAVGKVLGETYFLVRPIWDKYPELMPIELV